MVSHSVRMQTNGLADGKSVEWQSRKYYTEWHVEWNKTRFYQFYEFWKKLESKIVWWHDNDICIAYTTGHTVMEILMLDKKP